MPDPETKRARSSGNIDGFATGRHLRREAMMARREDPKWWTASRLAGMLLSWKGVMIQNLKAPEERSLLDELKILGAKSIAGQIFTAFKVNVIDPSKCENSMENNRFILNTLAEIFTSKRITNRDLATARSCKRIQVASQIVGDLNK